MGKTVRIGLVVAAWLLALILVAVGAAYFYRMAVAEAVLRIVFAEAGYEDARFTITELSATHATIENLRLADDGPAATRIDATYVLGELLGGKIRSVLVAGAVVAVDLDKPSEGGKPFDVDLTPLSATGMVFRIENASINLKGGPVGALALTVNADADFSQEAGPITLTAEGKADNETLKLSRLAFTGARVPNDERLQIDGTLDLGLDHWKYGDLTLTDVQYTGALSLSGEGTQASFDLGAPVRGRIEQSAADSPNRMTADLTAPSLHGMVGWGAESRTHILELPALTVDAERWDDGDYLKASLASGRILVAGGGAGNEGATLILHTKLDTVDFDIAGGKDAASAETIATGTTGPVSVKTDIGDTLAGTASLASGAVSLPVAQIALSGIAAEIPFSDEGLAGAATIAALARHTDPSPAFTPMRIEAALEPDDTKIKLSGTAKPEAALAAVTFAGTYDLAGGGTDIAFGPDTLTFETTGLQPKDLSPLLGDLIDADGKLTLEGSWTAQADKPVDSRARLTFAGFDGAYAGIALSGLSGSVDVVDLLDPKTPPKQTLKAANVTAPVPLDNPTVSFQIVRLLKDPLLRVEGAEGGMAGGRIFVGPTDYRLDGRRNDIVLQAQDIDLKTLFDTWTADRLTGTGKVSGRIPVTLAGGDVVISGGKIAATQPGVLKVHWGDARQALASQGQQVEMLVQVLEDFHYTVLDVGVERPAGEQVTLQVRLRGNNPGVLDGYPFNLNIGLSGNLETLLGALAEGQQLTMDLLRSRVDEAK